MKELESRNHQLPEYLPTEGFTPKEDQQLVDILKKLKGERISTPVYTELARILPQTTVEITIFRIKNNIIETLLISRPKDDIVWPNMLHTPGSAIRASDFDRPDQNPLNGAFARIQQEISNNEFLFIPRPVGHLYRKVKRGAEVADIYFTEIPDNSDKDSYVWYPVDKLSQNPRFIQHQLEHVLLAATQYQQYKNNQQP